MEVSGQLHFLPALPPGIGGWMSPRGSLDAVANPNHPSHSLVTILAELGLYLLLNTLFSNTSLCVPLLQETKCPTHTKQQVKL